MTPRLGTWLIGYGAFLIAVGVGGYLSNPEKAATALLSGGGFGSLSIAWGVLLRRGRAWAGTAALVTTGLLSLVFAWRATAGWMAVSEGRSEKLVAACLVTAMLVASVGMAVVLGRGMRRARATGAPAG